ncbi:MAG: hypothetical protein C4555_04390 [Dehalococcoidia bacterium]|nr:MAG: hypothetical protein C4555_04390 [Dehalococcoidia bacterium]
MQRTYLNQTGTVLLTKGAGTLAVVCMHSAGASVAFHDTDATGSASAANKIITTQSPATPSAAMDTIALPLFQFTTGLVMVAGAAVVSVAVDPNLG